MNTESIETKMRIKWQEIGTMRGAWRAWRIADSNYHHKENKDHVNREAFYRETFVMGTFNIPTMEGVWRVNDTHEERPDEGDHSDICARLVTGKSPQISTEERALVDRAMILACMKITIELKHRLHHYSMERSLCLRTERDACREGPDGIAHSVDATALHWIKEKEDRHSTNLAILREHQEINKEREEKGAKSQFIKDYMIWKEEGKEESYKTTHMTPEEETRRLNNPPISARELLRSMITSEKLGTLDHYDVEFLQEKFFGKQNKERDTGEEPGMKYMTTVAIPQISSGFNSLAPGKIAGNWRFSELEETIEDHRQAMNCKAQEVRCLRINNNRNDAGEDEKETNRDKAKEINEDMKRINEDLEATWILKKRNKLVKRFHEEKTSKPRFQSDTMSAEANHLLEQWHLTEYRLRQSIGDDWYDRPDGNMQMTREVRKLGYAEGLTKMIHDIDESKSLCRARSRQRQGFTLAKQEPKSPEEQNEIRETLSNNSQSLNGPDLEMEHVHSQRPILGRNPRQEETEWMEGSIDKSTGRAMPEKHSRPRNDELDLFILKHSWSNQTTPKKNKETVRTNIPLKRGEISTKDFSLKEAIIEENETATKWKISIKKNINKRYIIQAIVIHQTTPGGETMTAAYSEQWGPERHDPQDTFSSPLTSQGMSCEWWSIMFISREPIIPHTSEGYTYHRDANPIADLAGDLAKRCGITREDDHLQEVKGSIILRYYKAEQGKPSTIKTKTKEQGDTPVNGYTVLTQWMMEIETSLTEIPQHPYVREEEERSTTPINAIETVEEEDEAEIPHHPYVREEDERSTTPINAIKTVEEEDEASISKKEEKEEMNKKTTTKPPAISWAMVTKAPQKDTPENAAQVKETIERGGRERREEKEDETVDRGKTKKIEPTPATVTESDMAEILTYFFRRRIRGPTIEISMHRVRHGPTAYIIPYVEETKDKFENRKDNIQDSEADLKTWLDSEKKLHLDEKQWKTKNPQKKSSKSSKPWDLKERMKRWIELNTENVQAIKLTRQIEKDILGLKEQGRQGKDLVMALRGIELLEDPIEKTRRDQYISDWSFTCQRECRISEGQEKTEMKESP